LLPIFVGIWFLKLYVMIFYDFYADFGGFWPFFEDLEPDLRLDLGRKLGGGYQLNIYI
jgi:hypothetical protein